MRFLKRILPIIFPLFMIFYVIYFTKPPNSWQEASPLQILVLFIPLLFAFSFFANLFINYLPRSFIVGLGGIVILGLQAAGNLNPLTGILVIILTFLLARSFKKHSHQIRNTRPGIVKKLL